MLSKRFEVNVVPPFFVCKAEFVHILGIVKSKKKSDNQEIVNLSEKQLNVEINSSVSLARRIELQKLRSEKVLSCIVTGQHSYGVKRSGLGMNAI